MKESVLEHKKAVVEEIKTLLQESHSVVVVEYKGLTVADVTELREKFRENNVKYKVFKNTMVNLAMKDLGYEGYEELLSGPNAFAFSKEEIVDAPKISVEFAKDHKDKFTIKAGIVDGNIVAAEDVSALAKLPSKDVLLSMVLRALQGPISGLANVSQGVIRSAVYALNAVKEKKEKEETAA